MSFIDNLEKSFAIFCSVCSFLVFKKIHTKCIEKCIFLKIQFSFIKTKKETDLPEKESTQNCRRNIKKNVVTLHGEWEETSNKQKLNDFNWAQRLLCEPYVTSGTWKVKQKKEMRSAQKILLKFILNISCRFYRFTLFRCDAFYICSFFCVYLFCYCVAQSVTGFIQMICVIQMKGKRIDCAWSSTRIRSHSNESFPIHSSCIVHDTATPARGEFGGL